MAHYAGCHLLNNIMLRIVVLLNAIMLSGSMLNVVILKAMSPLQLRPAHIVKSPILRNYMPGMVVGNCNIDFFNFCHCQVWNFKILNLFEQNWYFPVTFWKYRKSKKYFAISWKPSVIPLKFCEMSLVSWNLTNYCKILQFLIKFGKSLKDLRKNC